MRMISSVLTFATVIGLGSLVRAQAPAAPQPSQAPTVKTVELPVKAEANRQPPAAVKVDIVVSRTNDNKTLSSLPFSLHVAEGRRTSLRLGSQVPIPVSDAGPFNYQNVGSNLDCDITMLSDGRYRLGLTVDDSSLAEGGTAAARPTTPPVIRSFRIDTMLVLRNGETTTFNVSTDKVSGDTIRAQVTVTALK
jgi:hypothetical protein